MRIGYSNWIAANPGTTAIANNNLRDAINGCVINNGADWAVKMKKRNIEALDIYWYVTGDGPDVDSPDKVARHLLQTHKLIYDRLPEWNTDIQEIV